MPYYNNDSGTSTCSVLCLTIIFLILSMALFSVFKPDQGRATKKGPLEQCGHTCPICNVFEILAEIVRNAPNFLQGLFRICEEELSITPLTKNCSGHLQKTSTLESPPYDIKNKVPTICTKENIEKSLQNVKEKLSKEKIIVTPKKEKADSPPLSAKEIKLSEEKKLNNVKKKEICPKLSNLFKKVKDHGTQSSDNKVSSKKGQWFGIFKSKSKSPNRGDPKCVTKEDICSADCLKASLIKMTPLNSSKTGMESTKSLTKTTGPCSRCSEKGETCQPECPKSKA